MIKNCWVAPPPCTPSHLHNTPQQRVKGGMARATAGPSLLSPCPPGSVFCMRQRDPGGTSGSSRTPLPCSKPPGGSGSLRVKARSLGWPRRSCKVCPCSFFHLLSCSPFIFSPNFFLHLKKKLRCDSHTINLTPSKCMVLWF